MKSCIPNPSMERRKVSEMKHRTDRIIIEGKSTYIDSELSMIIRQLNDIGLITTHCCQGGTKGQEYAYITFDMTGNKYFDYDIIQKKLTIRWNRSNNIFCNPPSTLSGKHGETHISQIEHILNTPKGEPFVKMMERTRLATEQKECE